MFLITTLTMNIKFFKIILAEFDNHINYITPQ